MLSLAPVLVVGWCVVAWLRRPDEAERRWRSRSRAVQPLSSAPARAAVPAPAGVVPASVVPAPAAPVPVPAAALPTPDPESPVTGSEPDTVVVAGPFPGSVRSLADGSAPTPEYTVKAKPASKLFHSPDSPYYRRTRAEIWFRTEQDARDAGFRPWKRA